MCVLSNSLNLGLYSVSDIWSNWTGEQTGIPAHLNEQGAATQRALVYKEPHGEHKMSSNVFSGSCEWWPAHF